MLTLLTLATWCAHHQAVQIEKLRNALNAGALKAELAPGGSTREDRAREQARQDQ